MKLKQISICTGLAISLSLISTSPAFSDQKNPGPTAAESSDAFKSAMDKFREDQKAFQIAAKEYEAKRREINKAFKDAVEKALADARAFNAPGQSQLQKRQGVAAKQTAVMAATAIRDAAIDALGLPPVPPTPPAKAPKVEKKKKPGPQGSPTQPAN